MSDDQLSTSPITSPRNSISMPSPPPFKSVSPPYNISEAIVIQSSPHSSPAPQLTPLEPSPQPLDTISSQLLSLSEKLSLPEVVVTAAKRILQRIESEPSFTKPTKSTLVRASLFAACRQLGIVKTFNEFELDLPR